MKNFFKKTISFVLAAAVFFSMPLRFDMSVNTVYAAGVQSVTPDWKFTEASGNKYWLGFQRMPDWQLAYAQFEDDRIKYSDMSGSRDSKKFANFDLSGSKANTNFSTPAKVSTQPAEIGYGNFFGKLQYYPFTLSAYVPAYKEIKMTYNFSVTGEYALSQFQVNSKYNREFTDGREGMSVEVFCWDDASTPSDLQIQIGRTTDRSPGNNNGARARWTGLGKKTRIDFNYTVTYTNDTSSPKYVGKNFAFAVSNQDVPVLSFDIKDATLTVTAKNAEQRDCVAIYQERSGGDWIPASLETALDKVYDGGTVKLTKSCTLEEQYSISKNITLTSENPSSPLTMTRATDVKTNFNINSGGTLTLKNIIYDGGGKSVTANAQGLSMFRVPEGGTLNLQSGCVIKNNYKNSGSGNIAIYGTMTMENGASITGCEITGGGGAVWVAPSGSFTMKGGTISGCTASGGGAAVSADGTFIMSGGTISGNTDSSANKCDILLRADKSGNVTLKGGSVSGNTNSVYNNGMTVTISGSPTVSGKIYSTNAVNASGSTTKNYTVQMSAIPADKIIVKGSTDTTHWSLANDGYDLKASGANLIAAKIVTVTYNYMGATGNNSLKSKNVYADFTYGNLPNPKKTGYTFSGWYTASSGGTKVTSSSTVTNDSDHTIYARWSTCSHTWNSGTVTKDSTCSAVGTKQFTCTKCGQTKTEEIAKKSHTVVTDKAVAATCTKSGLTEGSHCSVCKAVIVAQKTVTAKGHKEVTDAAKAATCTETGLTEGKHCSVCGTVIKSQTTIQALGHNFPADVWNSDGDGHWHVCTRCSEHSEPIAHNWDSGTVTKKPTCTGKGEMVHVCTVCDQTKTEEIAALGHSYGEPAFTWSDDNISCKATFTCGNDNSHIETIDCRITSEEVPDCEAEGYITYTAKGTFDGVEYTDTKTAAIPPTGHDYGAWEITIEPTLETTGTAKRVCGNNSAHEETTELPALSDTDFWSLGEKFEPTCTTEGSQEYISETYGSITVDIPMIPHTEVIDEAVAPTCTENGKTEGSHCSVCNGVIIAQETIDALGHTEEKDAGKAATCTESGLTEGKHCSVCDETLTEQEIIPALGHDFSDEWHSDEDNHWHFCTRCDADSGLIAHDWGESEVTETPACIETGKIVSTCSVCGRQKTEEIEALGHDYGEPAFTWSDDNLSCTATFTCGRDNSHIDTIDCTVTPEVNIPVTCEADGETLYTAAVTFNSTEYTDTKTVTVSATGHDYGAWEITTKPTLEKAGIAKRVCGNNSAHEETAELPALSDTDFWSLGEKVEPTCTKEGSQEYTSETYGSFTVEFPMIPHTEVTDEAVAPTCTEDGKTEGSHCSVCSTVIVPQETIPANGHSWDNGVVTTPPTEKTEGVKTYTCTTCGQIKTEPIAKLGHIHDPSDEWTSDASEHWHTCSGCTEKLDFSAHTEDSGTVTVKPTETTEGTKTFKCTVCGYVMRTETIPAIGTEHVHDFGTLWKYDDTDHWHECVCGEKKDTAAHTWNSGEITKQPTSSAKGEKTFECTVCGATKTETIPATGGSSGGHTHPQPDYGSISEEVQPGENAPKTEISTPLDELADIVLTPAEKAEVNDGTDIIIILKIEDGTYLVPASDKTKVETAIVGMRDYKLGQYLDVNLLKIIGSVQENIHETDAPITVMFEVPEALLGEGREYSVIRVHDGETAVLPDLDEDEKTVTIRTDKFSTYALAYSEKTGSDPSDESSDPIADTSDPTSEDSDPADSGDTSSGSSEGSSDNSTTSPSGESSSTGDSSTESGTSPSTDENNSVPSESIPSGNTENPATGIAVSIILLVMALSALIVVKRKKK